MLTNKWIQFGLSALIAFAGVAVGFDWTGLVGAQTGGVIVATLGGVKMVLNALAPAPGAPVVATDGALVTHKSA